MCNEVKLDIFWGVIINHWSLLYSVFHSVIAFVISTQCFEMLKFVKFEFARILEYPNLYVNCLCLSSLTQFTLWNFVTPLYGENPQKSNPVDWDFTSLPIRWYISSIPHGWYISSLPPDWYISSLPHDWYISSLPHDWFISMF